MTFWTSPERRQDTVTCHYCGLVDDRVEAGGVYYCPNPLCTGCGAAPHRRKLKSYADDPGDRKHSIDVEELYATYWPEMAARPADDPMRQAAERSVEKMIELGWLAARDTGEARNG
jgi:hypothetical protein